MVRLLMRLRVILSAASLALLVLTISGAHAQQPAPGLVNPTASAVKEQQLLQQLQQVQGRVSIPDNKSSVLIQPGGRDWRAWNQTTLHWVGGIAVLGAIGLLVVFYLMRGTVPIEGGRIGRKLLRFSSVERFVHWMTAVCFIILGLTGLNITFGKTLILPLIGPEAFTAISQWGKYFHNYLSFGFAIGIVVMFVMWISGNIPNRDDVKWIKEGGGIIGAKHPPAGRFNAGQKITFWVVFLFGVAISVTGYLLMFPFYGTTMSGMQLAAIIHGIVGVLFVAFIFGHIYIGTLGMEGAFESMGSGEVDVNWAKQHHAKWIEEQGTASGPVATNPGQRPPRPIPAE